MLFLRFVSASGFCSGAGCVSQDLSCLLAGDSTVHNPRLGPRTCLQKQRNSLAGDRSYIRSRRQLCGGLESLPQWHQFGIVRQQLDCEYVIVTIAL